MKKLLLSLTAGALAFSTVACDEDTGTSGPTQADFQATLVQYKSTLQVTTSTVIEATYMQLRDRAGALKTAVDAIRDANTLAAAQAAWRSARVPWESSEAFLWGPVANLNLDPQLDSWPVAFSDMDAQISGTADLTVDSLNGLYAGNLRGFHTIEYLLFGDVSGGDARELSDFLFADPGSSATEEQRIAWRTYQYLTVITQVLVDDATTLYDAWATGVDGGEAYGAKFVASGTDGGAYYSTKDAMSTLVSGMVDIITEVGEEKIASPYNAGDVTQVESQFSYNSLTDFQNNIQSVSNIYQGPEGAEGTFMSEVVAEQNAELDTKIKTLITESIAAIAAISEDGHPFRYYVANKATNADDGRVQKAIDKLAELKAAMDDEVGALF